MTSSVTTHGLTLDAGALIALDEPSKAAIMQARLDEARRRGGGICIAVMMTLPPGHASGGWSSNAVCGFA